MIVPEDELPPLSEVERMARREPPAQFTQPEHKLYAHRPPSTLLVMVCRACDLIMCDYNWLTRTGSSDPTVKLQVEGRDEVDDKLLTSLEVAVVVVVVNLSSRALDRVLVQV